MQQMNSSEKEFSKAENLPTSVSNPKFIGAPMRDPSLFLAKKMADPVPSSKSEKDTMPGPSSDKLANQRLLSGSVSSLSSTEDEDREQLIMNGSLTFPSEDRNPVGSADIEKDTTHFSDASPEPEGNQNTSERYQGTVGVISTAKKLLKSMQHSNDKNDDRQQQLEHEINSLEDYLSR